MEYGPDKIDVKEQMSIAPLLLNVKAVASVLSLSPSILYRMSSTGELGPMPPKFGKRRLWRYEELAA